MGCRLDRRPRFEARATVDLQEVEGLHMNVMNALILATAIVVGGYLVGGQYDSHTFGKGGTVVVDRFTGTVRVCDLRECRYVR